MRCAAPVKPAPHKGLEIPTDPAKQMGGLGCPWGMCNRRLLSQHGEKECSPTKGLQASLSRSVRTVGGQGGVEGHPGVSEIVPPMQKTGLADKAQGPCSGSEALGVLTSEGIPKGYKTVNMQQNIPLNPHICIHEYSDFTHTCTFGNIVKSLQVVCVRIIQSQVEKPRLSTNREGKGQTDGFQLRPGHVEVPWKHHWS